MRQQYILQSFFLFPDYTIQGEHRIVPIPTTRYLSVVKFLDIYIERALLKPGLLFPVLILVCKTDMF